MHQVYVSYLGYTDEVVNFSDSMGNPDMQPFLTESTYQELLDIFSGIWTSSHEFS